jgi:hypothetical protein
MSGDGLGLGYHGIWFRGRIRVPQEYIFEGLLEGQRLFAREST